MQDQAYSGKIPAIRDLGARTFFVVFSHQHLASTSVVQNCSRHPCEATPAAAQQHSSPIAAIEKATPLIAFSPPIIIVNRKLPLR
jgi:hypothetical protein